jgi:alpha-N-arabinofuranosidase
MPQGVENKTGKDGFMPNGNFTFTDNFTNPALDYRWIGVRGPREEFVSISSKGMEIKPFAANIKELKPTSTLFYRQQHRHFSATTTLSYKPQSNQELAGLVCYQK